MHAGTADGIGEHDATDPAFSVTAEPVPLPTMSAPTEPGWYVINRPHSTVQLALVVRYPGTNHLMAFSSEMGWLELDNPFLAWRSKIDLPPGAAGWSGL
jgi:hypothetical protein